MSVFHKRNNPSSTPASSCTVYIGTLVALQGTSRPVPASNIRTHPSYSDATLANDLAVLLISPYSNTTNIGPIQLPASGATHIGQAVVVAGWGETETGGQWLDRIDSKALIRVYHFAIHQFGLLTVTSRSALKAANTLIRDDTVCAQNWNCEGRTALYNPAIQYCYAGLNVNGICSVWHNFVKHSKVWLLGIVDFFVHCVIHTGWQWRTSCDRHRRHCSADSHQFVCQAGFQSTRMYSGDHHYCKSFLQARVFVLLVRDTPVGLPAPCPPETRLSILQDRHTKCGSEGLSLHGLDHTNNVPADEMILMSRSVHISLLRDVVRRAQTVLYAELVRRAG